MTSILRQQSPEEQATSRAWEQFRAAGSPGYKPEAQKYTWEQLHKLPDAQRVDASGNRGAGFSGTAVFQDWQQRANRNTQGESDAFKAWRAGGSPTSSGGPKPMDMSAYTPKSGGFNAYSPPPGARQNDLSGQVPANQMWAQAYNQAAQQYGGNTRAQSWTMPGRYSTQSFNPSTGQYSQPTGGQSWDGNMAYNAIDSRPGPITAQATGVGGNQMQWQDAMRQREAFVGNLLNRLGQYTSGQRTGPVTFDTAQLLSQADDQLANGTFFNPFSAPQQAPSAPPTQSPVAPRGYDPAVQGVMDNATQFMRGTQWQNPFGNSWQANNPLPTWGDEEYDARRLIRPEGTRRELDPRFQRR